VACGHGDKKEQKVILESMIQDEAILTIDCAKATLRQGIRVEIDDELYFHNEVQSAIKQGFVRLVGEVPVAAAPIPEEFIKTLKNISPTRLALDCIKGSVGPGETIDVPESKMEDPEIANALAWGMLEDPDGMTAKKPMTGGAPVNIDEVSILDEEDEEGDDSADLSQVNISEAATSKIVKTIVDTYTIMPLTFDGDILTVAVAEENDQIIKDLKFMLNCEVRPVLADKDEILGLIEKHYNAPLLIEAPDAEEGVDVEDIDDPLDDLFGPEDTDDAFVRSKESKAEEPQPEDSDEDIPLTRPVPTGAIKAKPISRSDEGGIEGGDDDDGLFAPSEVYDPEASESPTPKDKADSSEKTDNEDDNDFMSVFGDGGD
jgi:hypothetical protein